MTNIFNTTIWNLSGVSGYPGPLDGGEVGDGTDFFQHGSYCKLSPRGNSYRRSCRCSFSRSGGRRDTGPPGLDDPTSGGNPMALVISLGSPSSGGRGVMEAGKYLHSNSSLRSRLRFLTSYPS